MLKTPHISDDSISLKMSFVSYNSCERFKVRRMDNFVPMVSYYITHERSMTVIVKIIQLNTMKINTSQLKNEKLSRISP